MVEEEQTQTHTEARLAAAGECHAVLPPPRLLLDVRGSIVGKARVDACLGTRQPPPPAAVPRRASPRHRRRPLLPDSQHVLTDVTHTDLKTQSLAYTLCLIIYYLLKSYYGNHLR